MSALLEVAALLTVFDDGDGLVATLLDELCFDGSTRDVRRADLSIGAIVSKKDLVELDDVADFARGLGSDLLDLEDAVLRDNVLLSAGLYNSYFGHIFVGQL